MSLPLAITIIVLADVALIALLTFVMSRASRLSPHAVTTQTPAAHAPARVIPPTHPARTTRHAGRRIAGAVSARS